MISRLQAGQHHYQTGRPSSHSQSRVESLLPCFATPIGSCTLKHIAWAAPWFPNEGRGKMENSGWAHYRCIFKFPGEVWKLELALGLVLFLFFPSFVSFLLVWLTLVTGLHNFIRLGLMNHSSPASNIERSQARQGLCCGNQKQQKSHPHQEPGNGGWEKRDSGPTALMDSFPMSGPRQLAAHSFVSLPDLLGNLKGCCYL